MKIALLDLNHITRGITTNTVPLGSGLIATYLKKKIGNQFDIRIIKNPFEALKLFKSWIPDIIGIAQYSWNSMLNLFFVNLIREKAPHCVVVAGGPNLYLSKQQKHAFLSQHREIDVCVEFDGEIPFSIIVNRLLLGEDVFAIRENPTAGTYSLHPQSNSLSESGMPAPRIKTLDVFGSVYTEGIFDEFLEQGHQPFIQTHRGCPFSCIFFYTSHKYYKKMIFQSPELFRKDIEHLAKRFSARRDVTLWIANTNMSLFKEDFEIAEIIREMREKYDWPVTININSGKDTRKLLEMQKLIDFTPGLALQSLTPNVLKNIGRKNITMEEFSKFQKHIVRQGRSSSTELILSLPGETKQSFVSSLETTMNSGVQNVVVYTLMNLRGAPLAEAEWESRFHPIIRYRLVPRSFSEISSKKIFDTEEVVIGTDTMSINDYFELRKLVFSVSVFFNSIELVPLKRFLLENKVPIAQWLFRVHEKISQTPLIRDCFQEFIRETHEELFLTKEDLVQFYTNNYQALLDGKLGDNLTRKYKCMVLSNYYSQCLELVVDEARQLCEESHVSNAEEILKDIQTYLSTRDFKLFSKKVLPEICTMRFDVPTWMYSEKARLSDLKGHFRYKILFTAKTHKEINDSKKIHGNLDLVLQMLYRDGMQRFWPEWLRLTSEQQLPIAKKSIH